MSNKVKAMLRELAPAARGYIYRVTLVVCDLVGLT